jgi:hypothetical protein
MCTRGRGYAVQILLGILSPLFIHLYIHFSWDIGAATDIWQHSRL